MLLPRKTNTKKKQNKLLRHNQMKIILDLIAAFISIGRKEPLNLHSVSTAVEGRQIAASGTSGYIYPKNKKMRYRINDRI